MFIIVACDFLWRKPDDGLPSVPSLWNGPTKLDTFQNETFESKFSYECGIRIIILLTHISVPYVTSIFKC